MIICLGILGLSIFQPYADARGGVPLEWIFLGVWFGLGALFWTFARRRRAALDEGERRRLIVGT